MAAAKALSTLRAKHLRALEELATITQDLTVARSQNNNTDALDAALRQEKAKFEAQKLSLESQLKTLGERLQLAENSNVTLVQDNTVISNELKQWQDQCALLTERIETQKSAFVTSSDEVSNLRNELSTIKTKHQNELEKLATSSTQDLATLADWRRRAERMEAEHLMTSSKSQNLSGEVLELQQEIKRLKEQRKKDHSMLSEQANKLSNLSKQQIKEMEALVESMKLENNALQLENNKLKKGSLNETNELRNAKRKIKTLEEQILENNNRFEFMNKALEQAKSEWSKLSQENSILKQRLEQLEKLASGGSKFAKFVAVKEENAKLSTQLSKAHRQVNVFKKQHHLKKKHRQVGGQVSKFRPGQQNQGHYDNRGMPRRPETTIT